MSERNVDPVLRRAFRPIDLTNEQRARQRDILRAFDSDEEHVAYYRRFAEFGTIAMIVIAVAIGVAWWQQIPEGKHSPNIAAVGTPSPATTPTAMSTQSLKPTPKPTATSVQTIVPTSTIEVLPSAPPSICPVTKFEPGSFVPSPPYPPNPPTLYDAAWYGNAKLWTMLNPSGEVWTDLLYDDNGSDGPAFVQKTLWWHDGYAPVDEPRPDIAVTGRRLDKPAPSFEAGSPGTHGMRTDIGSFMLVGIEIPTPGCWELTGTYEGTSLTYVVWITASN